MTTLLQFTTRWLLSCAMICCATLSALPAMAATTVKVHDQIELLANTAEAELNQAARRLNWPEKVDLSVITVSKPTADETAQLAKLSATEQSAWWRKKAAEQATKFNAKGIAIVILSKPDQGYKLEVIPDKLSMTNGFQPVAKTLYDELLLNLQQAKNQLGDKPTVYTRAIVNSLNQLPATVGTTNQAAPAAVQPGKQNNQVNWLYWIIGAVVVFLIIRLIASLFAGGGGNYAPGYGGGSLAGSFLTSMFGAAAGMWMYDSFFGNNSAWGSDQHSAGFGGGSSDAGSGDFGDGSQGFGGDDFSGGGDFGGGDFGGGDFGGDF